jgi:3'(2'), 5'-bisphosphate nucleotidase
VGTNAGLPIIDAREASTAMSTRAAAEPDRVLEVAVRAGRLAATLCTSVLAEAPGGPQALEKAAGEPVTIADYGAQALILRTIREAFPDHAIVAEEAAGHLRHDVEPPVQARVAALVGRALGGAVAFEQVCEWLDHAGRPGSDFRWTVDPLDGTKGFLRGDQYAIAIGLLREGRPWAGVLVCPHLGAALAGPGREAPAARGFVFAAAHGRGATAAPMAGGAWQPIRATATGDPRSARIVASVEARHGDPHLVGAVAEDLGLAGGAVRVDSQVKYAVLARGEAEIYLRPRSSPEYREKVWDHAAGVVVLEEAGGRVTDMDGRPLDFSAGARLEHNRGLLATNGPLHDSTLRAIGRMEARGGQDAGGAGSANSRP